MERSEVVAEPREVLTFWFGPEMRARWFRATEAIDDTIRNRFEPTWRAAAEGRLDAWKETPEAALALVIVLDQFPLNMFRGRPESFSTEAQAREAAGQAIEQGWDSDLEDERKQFLYLPFMHSESLADQDHAVALYEKARLQSGLKWALHHRELIRKFGRFPHRNACLGRESSVEEQAYLTSGKAFRG